MILSCNSCEKKFVVPDNAIGPNGRLVQCSSCGNKWKQFPVVSGFKPKTKITEVNPKPVKIKKAKKPKTVKRSRPNLYSPEYLAKKYGIKIDEKKIDQKRIIVNKTKANFGFYNSLIVLIISVIFILRILFFTQDIFIKEFPFLEVYINYLFESIKNIKEIILNFLYTY